jgi:hypothetical protein
VLWKSAPGLAAAISPVELDVEPIGLVVHVLAMVISSLTGPRPRAAPIKRFEP